MFKLSLAFDPQVKPVLRSIIILSALVVLYAYSLCNGFVYVNTTLCTVFEECSFCNKKS